jgi:hypothetical protein
LRLHRFLILNIQDYLRHGLIIKNIMVMGISKDKGKEDFV